MLDPGEQVIAPQPEEQEQEERHRQERDRGFGEPDDGPGPHALGDLLGGGEHHGAAREPGEEHEVHQEHAPGAGRVVSHHLHEEEPEAAHREDQARAEQCAGRRAGGAAVGVLMGGGAHGVPPASLLWRSRT